MQPGQAPPRPPAWAWVGPLVSVVILLAAVAVFFDTHDPVLLWIGIAAAFVVGALLRPYRWYRYGWYGQPWWMTPQPPPQQVVKVKCASCGALNDEHARYCSACGKPV
jgi:hypothetical protein